VNHQKKRGRKLSKKDAQRAALLEEFGNLYEKLGLKVRTEDGNFAGGLCRIQEDRQVIVNRRDSVERRIQVLARGLRGFDLENVYVLPAVREAIEALP